MSEYNKSLQEGNDNREYEKGINIKSIKKLIGETWVPDKEIINGKNNNKTHFEKISNKLVEMGLISGKDDLAKKISELRDMQNNDNLEGKPKYSFDEIGIAIPEYVKENKENCTEFISIHKQTISRIIEKEKNK